MDKHKILGADDMPVSKVETPEWKPDTPCVWVRTLPAPEAVAFEESLKDEDGKENYREFMQRFCVLVICDENGDRVFSDEDAAELGKKNPRVLQRICIAAQTHNAMTAESREGVGKNSGSGQSDDST